MKTVFFLFLSLPVTLAMPPPPPGVAPNPGLTKENQGPLVGDMDSVEVEVLAPQVELSRKEQQEKMSPVAEVEDTVQPQIHVEQELKEEPEVKQELKEDPVKVGQELKEEPVKVEQELKEEPEVRLEQELKEEPEFEQEQEGMVALEFKLSSDVKAEQEFQTEKDFEEVSKVKVVPDELDQPEFKSEQEGEVQTEAGIETEFKVEPVEEQDKPEVNLIPDVVAEHQVEPDFREDPEVKVDSNVQIEPEPEDPLINEEFQVPMNREAEDETGEKVKEVLVDTERNKEGLVEPLDDDNIMFPEEEYDPADETLEEEDEEEGLVKKVELISDEDPLRELKPEMMKETSQNQELMPDMGIIEEGPALDSLGQQMLPSQSYFPKMESKREALKLQDVAPAEEPGPELVSEVQGEENDEEQLSIQGVEISPKGGRSCSSGVVLEGKCYQFYREYKRAADAELFCQKSFSGGHLASITTQNIHKEIMNLMFRQIGRYTRTWIGGLRYLDTGSFIWLDGAHWTYADWLAGEPNDTANVEDCLEVLANGKFNDFTCWEPQPFICSFPFL